MKKATDQILVIFGASGDLTQRKLLPAILELERHKLLPEKFALLGVGRTPLNDETFRKRFLEFDKESLEGNERIEDSFLSKLFYTSIDTGKESDYEKLKSRLDGMSDDLGIAQNYLFYLATPPKLYFTIPTFLAAHGLLQGSKGELRRLIIEKPFGFDLPSAVELNAHLAKFLNEDQIYRIDHYRGKETVQNLLVTRFANGIFEPLWNRNFIDHVEITSSESLGVEGRGGYYDSSGALRDMVQNHLLQVAGLVAMEPPSSLNAEAIRNETVKVFESLRPIAVQDVAKNVIRGQYTASTVRGKAVPGYRDENGVADDSRTETYVALKFFIDNWRWGGVPFYIRSGKRLPTKVTEVVISFKSTPHHLFTGEQFGRGRSCCSVSEGCTCNQLILRIQPDEGVVLKFAMKRPGAGMEVKTVDMNFRYADLGDVYAPGAYERLLHDAMRGDAMLYGRADAVELCWRFVEPILEAWQSEPETALYGYPAGTWGPSVADDLIEGERNAWRYPCKNLVNDGEFCEL